MNISDLAGIKRALLDQHKKYETPNADEYREGILSGITVALHTIDRLMEGEDEAMSRAYEESQE